MNGPLLGLGRIGSGVEQTSGVPLEAISPSSIAKMRLRLCNAGRKDLKGVMEEPGTQLKMLAATGLRSC